MVFHRVALYQTCPIPAGIMQRVQHDFDTGGQNGFPPPGHITLTPAPESTHGMTPLQIRNHHWAHIPEGMTGDPIVILDERTLEDNTVLVVAGKPLSEDDEDSEEENQGEAKKAGKDRRRDEFELPTPDGKGSSGVLGVRFIARGVPVAAVNLQIGNQDLSSYIYSIDDDRVWRSF